MGIKDYKLLFKWLRYHNRSLNIDLRNISVHFLDGTVISRPNDDPSDPDYTKILTSSSMTDIRNKIKEIIDEVNVTTKFIKERIPK
jgi:hypothetical protein